ncbi:unnamed protein product [Toxocara canis]|uniref:Uncharacterized protein n=1 Tax=Toxocara canis TaxID=6265 RepID=A0A183UFE6_TOXCA|nr:unnamed protein product [Toxocara canis]
METSSGNTSIGWEDARQAARRGAILQESLIGEGSALADEGLQIRKKFKNALLGVFTKCREWRAVSLKVDIRLLSSESYECNVSVMALTAGRLPFPRLQVRSSAFESSLLDEIVCMSMPAALFVLEEPHKEAGVRAFLQLGLPSKD